MASESRNVRGLTAVCVTLRNPREFRVRVMFGRSLAAPAARRLAWTFCPLFSLTSRPSGAYYITTFSLRTRVTKYGIQRFLEVKSLMSLSAISDLSPARVLPENAGLAWNK